MAGVLVVDDEEQLLLLTSAWLEQQGLAVFRARDGEEALDLFRRNAGEIRFVLTDLGMPKLGGADLIRTIKELNPEAFVIGVSGLEGSEVRSIVMTAGADRYLPKPYKMGEVLAIIEEVSKTT